MVKKKKEEKKEPLKAETGKWDEVKVVSSTPTTEPTKAELKKKGTTAVFDGEEHMPGESTETEQAKSIGQARKDKEAELQKRIDAEVERRVEAGVKKKLSFTKAETACKECPYNYRNEVKKDGKKIKISLLNQKGCQKHPHDRNLCPLLQKIKGTWAKEDHMMPYKKAALMEKRRLEEKKNESKNS